MKTVIAGPRAPAGAAAPPRGIALEPSPSRPAPEPLESADTEARRGRPLDTWWLLHTRPRCEKKLADGLTQRGFRHYLPLLRAQRRYGRVRRDVELPLFPGYVFLRTGTQNADLTGVWDTRLVANIVAVPDQSRLRAELAGVQRALTRATGVELFPTLAVGRRCRVRSGPLRDVEGVILRWNDAWRLCIGVTLIGQSAMVEIDAALLEPLD